MARAQYACSFSLYDDSMISVVRACVCVTRGLVVCPRVKKCDRGKSRGQVNKVWLRECVVTLRMLVVLCWGGTGAEGVVQKMSCHVMSCRRVCVCGGCAVALWLWVQRIQEDLVAVFHKYSSIPECLPPSSTPATTTIVA